MSDKNQIDIIMWIILKDIKDKITNVINNSDSFTRRIRICFKNNLQLRIVQWFGFYGGDKGLFEIAVIGDNGNFKTRDFIKEAGDDVIGYLSEDEVKEYIYLISSIK